MEVRKQVIHPFKGIRRSNEKVGLPVGRFFRLWVGDGKIVFDRAYGSRPDRKILAVFVQQGFLSFWSN